ncbi:MULTISPECIES: hypothetical protein [Flavobacteriaceae]|uniref:hypothetical protein n=1 Tax=Flavobacteriaceae TaxID=49546 RepID=UPI0025CE21AC|nr:MULTISPECIES: hypothetical protein [Flavobacteriaceae]
MEGFTFKVLDDDSEVQNNVDETIVDDTIVIDNSDNTTIGDTVEQESEVDDTLTDNTQPQDIDDARVLSYLKERYQKEYDSLDEVLTQKEKAELPEDVRKLMEFGVDNYLKINKDWNSESDVNVLKEYYKQTKPHLDDEDIDYLLEEEYSFDEDIDDERDIKKKKVALKEELFRAKGYLNDLKEQYKVDLGSNSAEVTDDYKKAFNFYQEYTETSKKEAEIAQKRSEVFLDKTNRLFNSEFKGFEFNLGDKKQVFKPSDVLETKNAQSDIGNVISNHLDSNGFLKDEHQYHKALAMFRDPDGFAKFFYEQGKSDATNTVIKDAKNISMSIRDNKDVTEKGDAPKMRVIASDDYEGGVKIRKRK